MKTPKKDRYLKVNDKTLRPIYRWVFKSFIEDSSARLIGGPHVKGFVLSRESLSSLDEIETHPQKGVKAKFIDLSNNNLKSVDSLKNVVKPRLLISLKLPDNQITSMDALADFTNLEYLSVANNKITEITGLDRMRNLRILDL
ncbi:MAG: hypothetical protein GF364_08160, partial [Candidatus Lokiarchaeota archaeon]|nr:hypothetical protein [Candidatus Lokiarchaeota archaeon]